MEEAFEVTLISTIFFLNEKEKIVEIVSVLMNEKGGCEFRLEAAAVSYILYLFVQGNLIFIRGKLGNFDERCMW